MRVGRILIDHLAEAEEGVRVGAVVVVEALFFLDGFALVVKILLRHLQRAHPVALQPERERQLVGGERLEVVGALG